MRLRPATPADIELLERWDAQPHVLASDPNDDWGWNTELARNPDWREQCIAEIDGRPIGFVQIIDPAREDSHYWGDVPPNLRAIDLWIGDPGDLNHGYGSQMLLLALARCFADPSVTAVLIDPLSSNTGAQRFYERHGFKFVEQRRFGADDCCVYRLDRPADPGLGHVVQIRPMRASDAAAVAAVMPDLGYGANEAQLRRRFEAAMSWPDHAAFVAESDGHVVGCVHAYGVRLLASDGYAEVGALVVKRGLQRRGIGARLLREAEAWAVHHGYQRVRLRSGVHREEAHLFYEAQGYERSRASYAFERMLPAAGSGG